MPARSWWIGIRVVWALILAASLMPVQGNAHSLGIDRAELIALEDAEYSLTSFVPESLQASILPPVLPEKCSFVGAPNGVRGHYSVKFHFRCEPGLTGDDTLELPWRREGVLLTTDFGVGSPVTQLSSRNGDVIPVQLSEYLVGSGSFLNAANRYLGLGFEHILKGLDHLLFVLALMMVVSGIWALVKTITAFTIAHSITLALATLGMVNVPSTPVEAAIALSIVFLCVEIANSWKGRVGLSLRYPWAVAFAFGLLHGLGFAGALTEIGLPPNEVPVALVFFNIGVELGQLFFVAIVCLTVVSLRSLRATATGLVNLPADRVVVYAVGTIATVWTAERVMTVLG